MVPYHQIVNMLHPAINTHSDINQRMLLRGVVNTQPDQGLKCFKFENVVLSYLFPVFLVDKLDYTKWFRPFDCTLVYFDSALG